MVNLIFFIAEIPVSKYGKSFPLMEHTEACRQSDPKAAPEIRNIEVLKDPPRSGAIFFVVAPSLIHYVGPIRTPDRRIFIIEPNNP